MRRWAAIAAALLLSVWMTIRAGEQGAPPAATTAPAPAVREDKLPPPRITETVPTASASASATAALPASLAGTDVDGSLGLDGDGRFQPDAGAIRLFDYFLSTLGEASLAQVRELVRGEAAGRVPGEEAAVLELFDRYVAYLGDAQAAATHAPPGATPRSYYEEVARLQQTRFGEALAGRLFGDDNALALAILDRSDAGLPGRLQAARAEMRAPAEVRARVETLRREGATDAQIWAERAARFGPDAANRLAALDQQRRARR